MALSDAEIGMFSINLKKTITGFILKRNRPASLAIPSK